MEGIAAGTAEIYTPGWLRLPVAVRGVAPGVYRTLGRRFGARAVALEPADGRPPGPAPRS